MHAEAQQNEKTTKVVDKDRYARAAESYEFYLANFPDAADAASCATCAPTSSTSSWANTRTPAASTWRSASRSRSASTTRTRCCRRWARSRRCASRRAGGKREIAETDRLFGEAADLYATLFPKDKEIVTVIYKNGQFFFDYGDYDEAVKRFGLIVERYPDDPERRRGGRPHPAGAQQGEGLREHRDLGAAAQEDQGVLVAATSRSGWTS